MNYVLLWLRKKLNRVLIWQCQWRGSDIGSHWLGTLVEPSDEKGEDYEISEDADHPKSGHNYRLHHDLAILG